jgi:acetyltransferase-like isoleucine patch superfamily enzyme
LKLLLNKFRQIGWKLSGQDISIGTRTTIDRTAKVKITMGSGRICIGHGCMLKSGVIVASQGGWVLIGNNTSLQPYTIIYGGGGVTIGNNVRIAAHCMIVGSNHEFRDRNKLIRKQGQTASGVTIEDDVWLGGGVKVVDGVTLQKGCVIGAGAVVTKSTEAYGIYVGIPAVRIGARGEGKFTL